MVVELLIRSNMPSPSIGYLSILSKENLDTGYYRVITDLTFKSITFDFHFDQS